MKWQEDFHPLRFPGCPWGGSRRLSLVLLKGLLVGLTVAALLSVLRFENVEDWQRWLTEYAGLFLVWRLLLYALIVWGWIGIRRRLMVWDGDETETRRRRWRVEIASVLVVVLLEVSQWLQRG
ncbi:MAG: hypothetical protein LBI87_10740 [Candidatus Accumulibacter sp.]|jgi:hypothetical protein|nr:hypothetical protein [Accumulibacter sp.]